MVKQRNSPSIMAEFPFSRSRPARTSIHTFMVNKVDVLIQLYYTKSYNRHTIIISFLEDMIHYINKMCLVRKYICDVLLL
jgi:hypothetical protein